MGLYWYAKANQMSEHNFTDDVAITVAISKKRAFAKISKLYGTATIGDISKVPLHKLKDVVILTDY